MSTDSVKMSIAETDDLREMLNYIADRNQVEQTERQLNNFIAESFKRHLALIGSYISTTNEIYELIALAGNNLRVSKIRQLLQQVDIQSTDVIQQFETIFKYIEAKLTQSNCRNVTAMNEYESQLANLQEALKNCEIHQKNRSSADLVRKIRIRVASLIEKIQSVEERAPEMISQALNGVFLEEYNYNRDNDEDTFLDEDY